MYLADDDAAGTDELTYRVADQFGAEATATILVGVAGRPARNNDPIPNDDRAFVRPGSTVSVPVLANDFDPDADPLGISESDEHRPIPPLGEASIDGSAIRYTAPEAPTSAQTSFRYTVDDGRGGQRSATVTLTFQDDGANRPPVARDDITDPQRVDAELDLPLLENDEDPDQDELEIVEVTYDGATIADDGRSVELVMPEQPVQFTYVVSDGTDTARAAVSVPLVDPDADLPPIARLDDEIEVEVGETVSVDVLANDDDPEGEKLHLFQVVGARHGSAEITGDEVEFTASEEGYVGDAGFSYVVGDDADPAVADTTVGSVRIRVTGGQVNTTPTFAELSVEVPQGGEREVDLRGAVDDRDQDDEHTFGDMEVVGDGFDADLDDGVLRVTAPTDAQVGASGRVEVVVSDGEDEVVGTVQVRVVSSEEPLATLVPDSARTLQGEPVDIDVLANDANPFPETPLEVTTVGTPSGGAGQVRGSGGRLTFTPSRDFFGETSFSYTVGDATGDATREVSGTVSVTVVGRPSAPPAPTCIGGDSGRVRVQWVAPSANGAQITSYVIRVAGSGGGTGDRTVPNASTQDVRGLTNGRSYTFQVGAVNEAVEGTGAEPAFSPPSPACTPDEVPGQPAAPVTEFGDRSLDVRWTLPTNNGSPIERLILTNTTSGESKELGPTVTRHTWEALENGTSVRFTLIAENALGRGPVSPPSTGDSIPAGPPNQPAAPDASPTVGARRVLGGGVDVEHVAGQRRCGAPLPDHVLQERRPGQPGRHQRPHSAGADLQHPERAELPVHRRGREQGGLVGGQSPLGGGDLGRAAAGCAHRLGVRGRHPDRAHALRIGERQRRRHLPLRVRHQRQRQLADPARRRSDRRPQQRRHVPLPRAGREQRGRRSRQRREQPDRSLRQPHHPQHLQLGLRPHHPMELDGVRRQRAGHRPLRVQPRRRWLAEHGWALALADLRLQRDPHPAGAGRVERRRPQPQRQRHRLGERPDRR